MMTEIQYENKDGQHRSAGYALTGSEYEGELYEIYAIRSDICDDVLNLAALAQACNVAHREGFAVYPVRDSFGRYVWWHWERRLVLCLGRGLWG